MPRIKPERVYGLVALSYLVLIPAGAIFIWNKIQRMNDDIDAVWSKLGMYEATPDITSDESVDLLRRHIRPNG